MHSQTLSLRRYPTHIFIVPGMHLAHEIAINLPRHYSLEMNLKDNRDILSFRITPVDFPDFVQNFCPGRFDGIAAMFEKSSHPSFDRPRSGTVVFLDACSGHTWWTKNFIISVLRLFAEADVYHGTDFTTEGSGEGRRITCWGDSLLLSQLPSPRDTFLSEEHTNLLGNFFSWLAQGVHFFHSVSALSISLRYFLFSYENRRLCNDYGRHSSSYTTPPLEDIVLRLTIALEALLAFSEKNEISFKIRTRAAKLLAIREPEATEIFELCNWAYETRSKVAHGDFQRFKESKKIAAFRTSSGRPDWNYIVMCLREVARRALLTSLNLHSEGLAREEIRVALDDPLLQSRTYAKIRDSRPIHMPDKLWPSNPRDRQRQDETDGAFT